MYVHLTYFYIHKDKVKGCDQIYLSRSIVLATQFDIGKHNRCRTAMVCIEILFCTRVRYMRVKAPIQLSA